MPNEILTAGNAIYPVLRNYQSAGMNPQFTVQTNRNRGILGSILGGVGGIVQSIINNKQQRKLQEQNFEYNKNMADLQYQRDIDMWSKANEYNSPSAQMKRLTDAGLNPNLMYGNSASAGLTATSLPKYQAPQANFDYKPILDLPLILGMFQNFNMRQAQIDNLKQENYNKQLINMLNSLRVGYAPDLFEGQSLLAKYNAEIQGERARRKTDLVNLEIGKKGMDIMLGNENVALKQKMNEFFRMQGIVGMLARIAMMLK